MPGTPREDARRLRERIEADLSEGRWDLARQHAATLWAHDPTMADAGFLVRCQERVRDHAALLPYRVAILRSFTVEPLVTLLRAGAFAGGIDLAVHVGGFNAYGQEILDPDSSLYRFQPAAVILAVLARDLAPELWSGRDDAAPTAWTALERAAEGFREYVEAFRANTDAALVVHDLEEPPATAGTSPTGSWPPSSAASTKSSGGCRAPTPASTSCRTATSWRGMARGHGRTRATRPRWGCRSPTSR